MQDHGDWPRALVMDLWGSATMRTGGEDLALALVLMGARPVWDQGSNRVTGIEILPLAELEHPRVDVTLRISGLFRDAFETQIALFDEAVRAVAARDEADDGTRSPPPRAASRAKPGAARPRASMAPRPAATAPGSRSGVERGAWAGPRRSRPRLSRRFGHRLWQGHRRRADADGFAARVRQADAFVHQQDHAEIDLLDSLDFAAYEGGFAAAADALGGTPALYHTDISRPEAPSVRTLAEEIARVVRGRAANPAWIDGMMRHGYRGAAEMRGASRACSPSPPPCRRVSTRNSTRSSTRRSAMTRSTASCARRTRRRARPWPRASTRRSAAISGVRAATASRELSEGAA